MIATIILVSAVCLLMIASILFFPKCKIGKITFSPYWVIVSIGTIILLASGLVDLKTVGEALTQNTAVNPLKILVLFISMTILSIYLDELGFFRYLAQVTLKRAKSSQMKLFFYLYLIVSVLTVFTSNDIIILSFTPFICYFAKNAKINPMPYLAGEFVAANTWSMALIIGNPTNIYLATAYGIDFLGYSKIMILPTLVAGIVAFGCLFLLFYKQLLTPLQGNDILTPVTIEDWVDLDIGIADLAICTALLAISSYIHLEMWYVSLGAVGLLIAIVLISSCFRKRKPKEVLSCLKRAPWQLIPFVLSMFIMIIALREKGVTAYLATFLGDKGTVFTYGVSSFLFANVINNIPMSVFFSSVMQSVTEYGGLGALFATVIGSNLGAFLTPVGALAGIMFSSILAGQGIKFGYFDFLKIGVFVAVPTLLSALTILWILL